MIQCTIYSWELWVKKNFLTKKDLKMLEDKINSLDVGTGIGRLPHRIASNYGGYTASQWKNWTLIYSMFCLKSFLPDSHLRMLAEICSRLPIPVFTSYFQDRQYQSRSVVFEVWGIICTALWQKVCDPKHASPLSFERMCN